MESKPVCFEIEFYEEDGDNLVLKDKVSEEDRDKLNDIFGKPMVIVSTLTSDSKETKAALAKMDIPEGTDPMEALSQMPPEALAAMKEQVSEKIDKMQDSIITQAGVSYVRAEYEAMGEDVDAIIVFLGTNDYNSDLPLGCWFTEKPEQVQRGKGGKEFQDVRLHRSLSMDQSTVRGRINVAMKHLKELYPAKQLILLTPLHRGYAFFGNGNRQPSEDYRNEQGLYIDHYVDAIAEAAHVWAVPVIDIYSLSGLLPTMPSQRQYFCDEKNDQLHPNTQGHQRLAKTLLTQLSSLPCTWE